MFNRVLSIPLLIVVLLVLMVSIVLIVFCKFYQKTISFKKIDRDKKKKSEYEEEIFTNGTERAKAGSRICQKVKPGWKLNSL